MSSAKATDDGNRLGYAFVALGAIFPLAKKLFMRKVLNRGISISLHTQLWSVASSINIFNLLLDNIIRSHCGFKKCRIYKHMFVSIVDMHYTYQ